MGGGAVLGRRQFLASGAATAGALLFSPAFLRDVLAAPATAGAGPYGPLMPPDAFGLMLPQGFSARQVARGGQQVGGYPWHFASDGEATYRTSAGGTSSCRTRSRRRRSAAAARLSASRRTARSSAVTASSPARI